MASRRIRVLYHYPGSHFNTGSPKALMGLIAGLNRDRFEPFLLASVQGPLLDAMAERDVQVIAGTIESVSYRAPIRAIQRLRLQRRLLRQYQIDIVHFNELGWNTDLVLAAWSLGVPVVLHQHNPISIDFQNLNRIAASRLLVVSEAHKAAIAHFGRIRDKCEVLYNASDLDAFSRGTRKRAELGFSENDTVVVCVAQISEAKGIGLLLEIARTLLPEHPGLVFAVAGAPRKTEEVFAARMIEEAAAPEYAGRVRFLGSRSDIPDVLASADVFFLPTRAETFGIAVVEAMAAGLPVVASDVGGVGEIIASADIGWKIRPDDVAGFTRALREILSSPDRGRSTGERARNSVNGRFDARTIGARLERIYFDLLSESRRTA